MEIIGYGILLAIGFYIAPLVVTVVGVAISAIVIIISSVIKGIFK